GGCRGLCGRGLWCGWLGVVARVAGARHGDDGAGGRVLRRVRVGGTASARRRYGMGGRAAWPVRRGAAVVRVAGSRGTCAGGEGTGTLAEVAGYCGACGWRGAARARRRYGSGG